MKQYIDNIFFNPAKTIFFFLGLSLPFPIIYNRVTVAGLLVYTIFIFYKKKAFRHERKFEYVGPMLLVLFFFAYFFTELFASTTNLWQVTDTYFLFLVFGVIGLLNLSMDGGTNDREHFLRGFLVGNISGSLLNLIRAFYFSLKTTDDGLKFDSSVWGNTPIAESINNYGNYFFSEYYSWFLHPSYASVYLEVCFAQLIFLILLKRINSKFGALLIVFILLNLYLLSSRIAIVAVLALLIFSAFYWSGSKKILIGLFLVAVVSTFINLLNPRTAEIFSPSILLKNERFQSWHSAILLLKDNWQMGVGVSNIKPEMHNKYLELGYQKNAEEMLNTHNQFLETTLASGVMGLMVLLFMLFFLGQRAYAQRDYLFLVFCICMTIHFLVESMLSRHEGIILFACFIAISRYPLLKRNFSKLPLTTDS